MIQKKMIYANSFLTFFLLACRNGPATEDPGSSTAGAGQTQPSNSDLTAQVTVCFSQKVWEGGNGQCRTQFPGPDSERPRTPDCFEAPSGSIKIEVNPGTKVTVQNVSKELKDSFSGTPYTVYKILGPQSLFSAVEFKSCWMEEKYLNMAELKTGFDKAAQKSADDSGVVTSTVQKTYLKIAPEDSRSLLSPAPVRREDAFFDSLQKLPSAFHNPQKACLLPLKTQIAFKAIKRSSAGGVVNEKGHVFVEFGNSPGARVGTTPVGINFAGSAPSHDYYYQEPYLSHWNSLIALYPKHSDFFKNGTDVSASATKIGLGCDLTSGWLFADHFEGWKSSMNVK